MAETNDKVAIGEALIEEELKYLPAQITFVRQVFKKDKTVATSITVVQKLNEGDADFDDNMKANDQWFASHGLDSDGMPLTGVPTQGK